MLIEGKHVVVTGAASGIGAALATRFQAEGARAVVGADVHTDGIPVADAVQCDVTSDDDLRGLIDGAESRNGPIDLFCSNAGVLGGFGAIELSDDEWRRVIDVNLMAHIRAARHLVPRMLDRGEGYLLQTASAAGLLTQIGLAPYSVTKHGAVAFAEWLSITYGERGIKVSVLCPQAVRTGMTAGTESGGVAGVDGMLEPEAVADAVVSGLATECFLILPHPEVAEYFRRKASDYDRWLAGMRRLQSRFPNGT
jgi:NAD(P)-dependent dehydrogenase (short-subunit alcohol dehydrogenase family)